MNMWHADLGSSGPRQGLHYHNRMAFTTYDRDQDNSPDSNCAVEHTGGWWFNSGHSMHPNGMQTTSSSYQDGD